MAITDERQPTLFDRIVGMTTAARPDAKAPTRQHATNGAVDVRDLFVWADGALSFPLISDDGKKLRANSALL